MALITENNTQYYVGEELYVIDGVTITTTGPFVGTFNADLIYYTNDTTALNYPLNNFEMFLSIDGGLTFTPYTIQANVTYIPIVVGNTITLTNPLAVGDVFMVKLRESSVWENYGNYAYTSLEDVINNFMFAYVGYQKLIANVGRNEVIFHAKRGLQEFSYDTLKSIKSQELTIPSSGQVPLPPDYVNYVGISYVDILGVKHPIYPADNLTSSPYYRPLQDSTGIPMSDANMNMMEGTSITDARWRAANTRLISGNWWINNAYNTDSWFDGYPYLWLTQLGQRYGLEPSTSQMNGWFNLDEREGKISFSSNLIDGRIIILDYISDGLAYDEDIKIPKLAEDAIYAWIIHAILGSRINQPEYVVARLKKERSAKLRNAKIRLSNIKLNEIVQVMRNKSKWIKH
jgi:hypothetical protein